MKDFICSHWKELLEAFILVLSIILLVVKKKPVKVVDTLKEIICRLLPACLNQAENTELKGDAKRVFALELLKGAAKEMGYDLDPGYLEFATQQIEVILSTPQKKGVKNGKKN